MPRKPRKSKAERKQQRDASNARQEARAAALSDLVCELHEDQLPGHVVDEAACPGRAVPRDPAYREWYLARLERAAAAADAEEPAVAPEVDAVEPDDLGDDDIEDGDAAAEDDDDIDGEDEPETEAFEPEELAGREVCGKPSTLELEQALVAYRLEPDDLLNWRALDAAVVIVTRGGRKLQYPGDLVPLSASERHGRPMPQNRTGRPAGFLQGNTK